MIFELLASVFVTIAVLTLSWILLFAEQCDKEPRVHAPPTKKQQKRYEFVAKMIRYQDVAKLHNNIDFPRYLIIGDQSTGKTSLVSRLARLPLGFTGNRTGTKRPFEFVLCYDSSCEIPFITVNGKPCSVSSLFATLKRENNNTKDKAFSNDIVQVVIYSAHVMSITIIDMPGLKDVSESDECRMPEEMIKEMLRNRQTIPVVLLEARDSQQTHRVYQVLKDAGREYEDIMVIVNKIDEKIQPGSQWDSPNGWTDYWRSLESKGFKKVFFAGWPGSCKSNLRDDPRKIFQNVFKGEDHMNRDEEGDQDHKMKSLSSSFKLEAEQIKSWGRRLARKGIKLPMSGMRLNSFALALNDDQMSHVNDFTRKCAECIDELELVEAQNNAAAHEEYFENITQNKLTNEVFEMVQKECGRMLGVITGDINGDLRAPDGITTLDEDLDQLIEEMDVNNDASLGMLLKDLGICSASIDRMQKTCAECRDKQEIREDLTQKVANAQTRLTGGAALKRDESLFAIWSYDMIRFHLSAINEELVENYLGKGKCEDSGNFVIKKESQLILEKSIHPLIDLMTVLLHRHIRASLQRARYELKQGVTGELIRKYEKTSFAKDFEQAFQARVLNKLLREFNKSLHSSLDASVDNYGYARLRLMKPELAELLVDNKTGFTPEASTLLGKACLELERLTASCEAYLGLRDDKVGKYFLCATMLLHDGATLLPVMGDIVKQIQFFEPCIKRKSFLTILGGNQTPEVTEIPVDVTQVVSDQVKGRAEEEYIEAMQYRRAQRQLAASAQMVQNFDFRALQLQFSCVILAHHCASTEDFGSLTKTLKRDLRESFAQEMVAFFNEKLSNGQQRAESYTFEQRGAYEEKKKHAAYRIKLLREARELLEGLDGMDETIP